MADTGSCWEERTLPTFMPITSISPPRSRLFPANGANCIRYGPLPSTHPEHQPYRRILTSLLSSRYCAPLHTDRARDSPLALPHGIRSRGACDVVADYAAALPLRAVRGAGGNRGRPHGVCCLAMRPICLRTMGPISSEPVMDRFATFLRALIAERRAVPGDDIITALLAG